MNQQIEVTSEDLRAVEIAKPKSRVGMFRKKSSQSTAVVPQKQGKENPFIAGRREYNFQTGRPIASANWWRIVAFVCSLIALASLLGLLKLGASTKIEPYVVVIDDLGRVLARGMASESSNGAESPRVRKSLISNFIMNVRGVTSDGIAQKERIKDAYAMLSTQEPAFQVLNDWFSSPEGDPWERAKDYTVSIQLSSILPLSESSYRAEWREITRDRVGKVTGTQNYQGIVNVRQSASSIDDSMHANPIGLFIREFTWTKRI